MALIHSMDFIAINRAAANKFIIAKSSSRNTILQLPLGYNESHLISVYVRACVLSNNH